MRIKANAYIDGFNLYYGCLRGTPFRWLDVRELCSRLLPNRFELQQVRYFTARMVPLSHDPSAPERQRIYLRALATVPDVSIHFGHFLKNTTYMPLANPVPEGSRTVKVIKTEEKGSDVNLACNLLLDAFKERCEAALVVTNDSDLLEPVRIARREFGLTVGLVPPHQRPANVLRQEADFIRSIRKSTLRHSQFPASMKDMRGEFTKPQSW